MDTQPPSPRTPGMVTDAEAQGTTKPVEKWWTIHLFRGMVNDVRRRAPYYWSDWRDAWDYRVVPATVYMYFAKSVSPAATMPSTSTDA